MSPRTIATNPLVAEQTVTSHVSRALGILGLHDRAQTVMCGYKTGPARPGEGPKPPGTGVSAATLGGMRKFSLGAIAKQHAESAATATTKRSATTVVGGHEHVMRQTVIALAAGATMAEHENPGEATVLVLSGRVRLDAGDDSWEGREQDLLEVPPQRHSLVALADSIVLLSVAKT